MSYVKYHSESEVSRLDQNVWKKKYQRTEPSGTSGRHLYNGTTRNASYYYCQEGRDPEIHYVINYDRIEHPDHVSYFGYANCPNGYCFGHMPGKYATSMACDCEPQPPNAAPKRFYSKESLSPFNVSTYTEVIDKVQRTYFP